MPKPYEVSFYEGDDFDDGSKSFDLEGPNQQKEGVAKNHDFNHSRKHLDNISSLKTGSNAKVTFWDGNNYQGSPITFSPGNNINLLSDYLLDCDSVTGPSWDNHIGSYQIESVEAWKSVEDDYYILPDHAKRGSSETATPPDFQKMYEKFAPLVVFSKDEDLGPSSVEWFLKQMKLKRRVYKGIDKDITDANPSFTKLMEYGGDHEDPSDNIGLSYFLKHDGSDTKGGQDFSDDSSDFPTCYVRAAKLKDNTDLWDLQYWFFYPYNGLLKGQEAAGYIPVVGGVAVFVGKHVGDWEHVTVRVSKSQQKIVGVAYHAHDSDANWETTNVELTDDGHPVVYAGYHSHACYYAGGLKLRFPCPDTLASDRNSGKTWKTWLKPNASIKEISYRNPKLNNQQWIRYLGVWGDDIAMPPSPYGPGAKSTFYKGDGHIPNTFEY